MPNQTIDIVLFQVSFLRILENMAHTIESARGGGGGTAHTHVESGKPRELLDPVFLKVDRGSLRLEPLQNLDVLFEKIKKKAGLNLPANLTSGIPPTGEPLGVKMDRVFASIGGKFIWVAGKVLTAVLILGWLVAASAVATLLFGVQFPF